MQSKHTKKDLEYNNTRWNIRVISKVLKGLRTEPSYLPIDFLHLYTAWDKEEEIISESRLQLNPFILPRRLYVLSS